MSAAATAPPRPRVAMIGLPSTYHLIPEDSRPWLAKGLAAVQTQMADAGIDYEFDDVVPENDLAALSQKLQSQRPDVVVIGNGIRRSMELTPFMEKIIDVIRASAPQAKLAFNTTPEDTIEAVRRWIPSGAK